MSVMRTRVPLAACIMPAVLALFPGCRHQNLPPERWMRTFGGPAHDGGQAVALSPDGGYVVAGYTWSLGAGQSDIYLVKTDAEGNLVWTRTFGDTLPGAGQSVQPTSDGGYIVAGVTSANDVCLVKTDAEGNQVWMQTLCGGYMPEGQAVLEARDRGYVVLCWTDDGPRLIKTDPSGHEIWTAVLDVGGQSVVQAGDGGYVIAGIVDEPSGEEFWDIGISKVDASGNAVWTNTFPRPGQDEWGNSLQPASGGGYVIAGEADSDDGTVVRLIRTDAEGREVWTKDFGGGDETVGLSVQRTTDGGYVVTGYVDEPEGRACDLYLLRLNADGDSVWAASYGGDGYDYGRSVEQTSDGGFVIAGETDSYGAGKNDVWLIKTDSEGDAEPDTL